MANLRKDYLLDNWVIISESRGKRPNEFESVSKHKPGIDFFAPGNEHLTPPEIGRIEKNGKWTVRWFPNKFAAVSDETFKKVNKTGFKEMPSFGYHEVIAETPSIKKQLWDLSENEIFDIVKVYAKRVGELSKRKNIKYVQVFKNHGKEAGTSLIHSHTQVVALPIIPEIIKKKKLAIKKTGLDYQEIVKIESKTKRKAFETKYFVAICPFASKFNYEIAIFPKTSIFSITEMNNPILKDLAKIISKILSKLKKVNFPYNFFMNYDPDKKMLFHMEFTPRTANWAGFEFSTGIIINSVSPEDAAKFYRGR